MTKAKQPKTYRNSGKPQCKPESAASGRDIASLVTIRDEPENLKQFGKAGNTRKAYSGHLARGQRWLAQIVEDAKSTGLEEFEGMSIETFKAAFDNPPNKYSATALELFLVQKCFTEGLKQGTADGIHAAFAEHWGKMDDQKYAGVYSYDKETDCVLGCPAKAPIVHTVMQAIKTRAVSKEAAATRQHAEALTIEDLTQMMQWSEKMCPNSMFQQQPRDSQMAKEMNLHGLMRAFSTTGFNLFTRNFETASIQFGDITFNCKGPAPVTLGGSRGFDGVGGAARSDTGS